MSTTVPSERLAQFLWERHANPWSGWTRVFAFPILVYAIFARRRRLIAAAAVAIAINPVVIPQPDDAKAWTSEVIQAERYWTEHGQHGTLLRAFDVANLPVTAGALYAAYRRKPTATAALTACSMALKFGFVSALVRHYESEIADLQADVTATDGDSDEADVDGHALGDDAADGNTADAE